MPFRSFQLVGARGQVSPADGRADFPMPAGREAHSREVDGTCSGSEPAERLTVVDWELTNGTTGLSLAVLPSAPGGKIFFTDLASGTYQVNQTVTAKDDSAQERSYGPFTINV